MVKDTVVHRIGCMRHDADTQSRSSPASAESVQGWPAAVSAGADAVKFYGGAAIGMRTLLDALLPFAEALTQGAGVDGASGQCLCVTWRERICGGHSITLYECTLNFEKFRQSQIGRQDGTRHTTLCSAKRVQTCGARMAADSTCT